VTKVVWSIRKSPKAVVDNTREFLRFFGCAAVFLMVAPVCLLAFPAPNFQMVSELTNKKEDNRAINNMRRAYCEQ
jgi:hypothetical protein